MRSLVRPRSGRVVAGVCAGLARRFGLSPFLVRLLFVLSLVLPGTQVVVYAVLWVLMPSEDDPRARRR
ncbi:PspC domain-containing protein [Quadrisphaera sp. DSM 44207]|uniref:PspC domain-containing protein n=1 Tax=Quadrisphaera sp. DSM 44207 TaxID=1881057 RepID=UPI00088D47FF|nr:PspC domain-containing protein [Quadrisphaera sp. DSM 44207]SDQ22305.1 phage shock protein C (PspC) family protein [Quadrisphaera sp. DSM 44207]